MQYFHIVKGLTRVLEKLYICVIIILYLPVGRIVIDMRTIFD
jgi:hypothetical protein